MVQSEESTPDAAGFNTCVQGKMQFVAGERASGHLQRHEADDSMAFLGQWLTQVLVLSSPTQAGLAVAKQSDNTE